jgi:hypothetical protein
MHLIQEARTIYKGIVTRAYKVVGRDTLVNAYERSKDAATGGA